jgi:hypothetical protein
LLETLVPTEGCLGIAVLALAAIAVFGSLLHIPFLSSSTILLCLHIVGFSQLSTTAEEGNAWLSKNIQFTLLQRPVVDMTKQVSTWLRQCV